MLAISAVSMTLPAVLLASPRKHNEFVREEMEKDLAIHHRLIMPGHFLPAAAARYGHMKRTAEWIAYKVRFYHTGTDLVMSGRSKAEVLGNRNITVSGSASSDTLRGRLTMRLPFGGGTGETFDDDAYARLEAALVTERDPIKRLWILKKLRNRLNNRGKTGVTPAQMVKELRTITPDEAAAATRRMGQGYINRIKAMRKPHLAAGVTRAMLN